MKERWKWIPGYRGIYKVSSRGRVKSVDRIENCGSLRRFRQGRILRQTPDKNDYLHVNLSKNGKVENWLVHKAVLLTFIGPCPVGQESRHRYDDKNDNSLRHLKYGTVSQNKRDLIRNGKDNPPKGENHPASKITAKVVNKIRKLYASGSYTQQSIADRFGIDQSNVSYICSRKAWKHCK